jgi:hypothetical protein
MQRLSYILTGTAVVGTALLLLFGAFLSTASAASPINFMNPALGSVALCSSVRLLQQDDFGNFDRESCEQSCRAIATSAYPVWRAAVGRRRQLFPGYYCMPPASTHVTDNLARFRPEDGRPEPTIALPQGMRQPPCPEPEEQLSAVSQMRRGAVDLCQDTARGAA